MPSPLNFDARLCLSPTRPVLVASVSTEQRMSAKMFLLPPRRAFPLPLHLELLFRAHLDPGFIIPSARILQPLRPLAQYGSRPTYTYRTARCEGSREASRERKACVVVSSASSSFFPPLSSPLRHSVLLFRKLIPSRDLCLLSSYYDGEPFVPGCCWKMGARERRRSGLKGREVRTKKGVSDSLALLPQRPRDARSTIYEL